MNKNGTIFSKELSSEKIPKTVSFGDSSKTSKSKADESQILNEAKISLPQGSSTDSVGWSLLLGYRNYIMHCFLFPCCVITCYLEVYNAEV